VAPKNSRPGKNRSRRGWIQRHLDDPYVRAATREGYRSRAAYKLIEIDDRDRLIRPASLIIELGAAPGSWSQVVLQRLARGRAADSRRGRLIAGDLLPVEPLAGLEFVQGDFYDPAVEQLLVEAMHGRAADLVLSDMSPNLSGIAAADAARSIDLCELALQFAVNCLRPSGDFVVKAFQGSGYSQLVRQLKNRFRTVAVRKPAASRSESSEVYLVARGLKAPPAALRPEPTGEPRET
jgi:23S rRNA (uridine2552-2'-O)-methyltransferase